MGRQKSGGGDWRLHFGREVARWGVGREVGLWNLVVAVLGGGGAGRGRGIRRCSSMASLESSFE